MAAALFALAVGVGAGLLLHRTFAAVIATVLVVLTARWAQYALHRQSLANAGRPSYWTVQWLDTAGLLTLAVALIVLVARRLHHAAPASGPLPVVLHRYCTPRWLVPLVPGAFALGLGLWGLSRWDTMCG